MMSKSINTVIASESAAILFRLHSLKPCISTTRLYVGKNRSILNG
jgi:hypothetical protein